MRDALPPTAEISRFRFWKWSSGLIHCICPNILYCTPWLPVSITTYRSLPRTLSRIIALPSPDVKRGKLVGTIKDAGVFFAHSLPYQSTRYLSTFSANSSAPGKAIMARGYAGISSSENTVSKAGVIGNLQNSIDILSYYFVFAKRFRGVIRN